MSLDCVWLLSPSHVGFVQWNMLTGDMDSPILVARNIDIGWFFTWVCFNISVDSDVYFFEWQHWGPILYCWTSCSTGTHIVANLRYIWDSTKEEFMLKSDKHYLRIGWKESLQQHRICCGQPMVSCKCSFQPIHWRLEIADQHQQLQSAAARQDFSSRPWAIYACVFPQQAAGGSAIQWALHQLLWNFKAKKLRCCGMHQP